MGCPVLHIDTLFSGYTPKLEVVRDEGSASNSEVDFSEGLILLFKYYPFGMLMPGRFGKAGNADYRYGFIGMEKNDEVKGGSGNHLDFGNRMLDSRLGRWMSIDKQQAIYPWCSPYVFVANKPVIFIDVLGDEIVWGQNLRKVKNKNLKK